MAKLERRRAEKASGAGHASGPVIGAGHLPTGSEVLAGEAARALVAGHASRPPNRSAGTSAAHLLALQRTAGNRAVTASLQRARRSQLARNAARAGAGTASDGAPAAQVNAAQVKLPIEPEANRQTLDSGAQGSRDTSELVQRAPATAPAHAKDRNDVVDLLNGFEDLAGAAVNDGGRRLDSVHFGADLSPVHRDLLQRIQAALIQAQEKSADSRRAAIAAWPSLDGRMREAIDHARRLGISGDFLATVANNLSAIGEMHVHAPRRGASQVETPDDYVDLLNGINRLLYVLEQQSVDKTDAVVPLNIGETNQKQRADLGSVQFGQHLTPRHREMLEKLRTAFILTRTDSPGSASGALALWTSTQGDLRLALRRMSKFLVDKDDRSTLHFTDDIAEMQGKLNGIGRTLFTGGVYSEAHGVAVKETKLEAPDQVRQVEAFKEAARELTEAEKLATKGLQYTGEDAISAVLSQGEFEQTGHEIFELVKAPGEIAEKLEKYKEQSRLGKAVTIAEIADKASGMARGILSLSTEIIKRFAEAQEKRLLALGLEKAAEEWGTVAKSMTKYADALKAIGKVATVITVIISVVRIVDLISQGKIAEAAGEAASTLGGLAAGLATGAGGAALIGGIEIIVAAEIEGLRGAAAMIEWAKDQNVHNAAWSYVGTCQDAASLGAQDFVADAKLLGETTDPTTKAMIEQKLTSYAKYWLRDLENLSNQVADSRAPRMGGQPDLVNALGAESLQILRSPETWAGSWPAMAEQIRIIFAGANAMTKYVYEHYSPKQEKKASEGE